MYQLIGIDFPRHVQTGDDSVTQPLDLAIIRPVRANERSTHGNLSASQPARSGEQLLHHQTDPLAIHSPLAASRLPRR